MKKLWILLVLFFTAACSTEGGEEINGKTPDQVAVEWVDAIVKSDDKKQAELLAPKERKAHQEYLNEKIAQNLTYSDRNIGSEYRLTEWKLNNDTFYYLMEYTDQITGQDEEKIKVVRTEEGWKVTDLVYPKDFEERIRDIEPKVVKEVAKQ